ncbi:unnamed protein product [Gadus morhua 'NCC']
MDGIEADITVGPLPVSRSYSRSSPDQPTFDLPTLSSSLSCFHANPSLHFLLIERPLPPGQTAPPSRTDGPPPSEHRSTVC